MTTPLSPQKQLLLFLLAALILMGLGIGLRAPWPADEPRFALIAREMVDSGQWLFPQRGGELYPDKPPIFMWLIGGAYSLLGNINIAFLLPSLFSGLITLWLVHDLTRRLYTPQAGLQAILLLLCTFQFMLQAKTAQIDMTVTLFITLGNYCLIRHLWIKTNWWLYGLAWISMGIGIITKGVGFLPIFLLLPYLLLSFSKNGPRPHLGFSNLLRARSGPLLMLSVIGLWLIPMWLAADLSQDQAFIAYRDNILFRQTGERYVHSLGHVKPFWYYLLNVIPAFWLPLSPLLIWLVPIWIRQSRARDWALLSILVWACCVLIFFSYSPGKRGVYVLPILPMLAVIAGPWLSQILTRKAAAKIVWGIGLFLGGILLLASLGGFLPLAGLQEKIQCLNGPPWPMLALTGTAMLAALLKIGPRHALLAYFAAMAILWGVYSTWGYRILEPCRSPRLMMEKIAAITGPEAPLAIVRFKEQLILQATQPVTHFGFHTDHQLQETNAAHWLGQGENRWVLIPRRLIAQCFAPDLMQAMGQQHGYEWMLGNSKALTDHCPSPEVIIPGYTAATPGTTFRHQSNALSQ